MNKSKIIGSAPVLMVHDVPLTANYYKDQLGFHYNRLWGEPPAFGILHRDAFSVMLNGVSKEIDLNRNDLLCKDFWDIYFWTDDVRSLLQEYQSNNVEIYHPLTEKDYGVLEFEVRDINGYILAFGEEME